MIEIVSDFLTQRPKKSDCFTLSFGLVGLALLVIISFNLAPIPLVAAEVVAGEVIVKMKNSLGSQSHKAFLGKAGPRLGLSLKASFKSMRMQHFKIDAGQDLKVVLQDLKQDPNVEYAEPNFILKKADDPLVTTPIDVMSMAQVQENIALNAASVAASAAASAGTANSIQINYSQNSAPVHVSEAWGILSSTTDKPVVAVIDSGVDYQHTIFTQANAIWINPGEIAYNQIDDDSNGYIDDVYGWNFSAGNANPMDDDSHGTHVAGIILGVSEDLFSSQNRESKVLIMPIKFLDAQGSGTTSGAIRAIEYAVNNGAQIINNSWGGSDYSASLLDALNYAYSKGVLVVNAAGNSGQNSDSIPIYPANYDVPGSISVAATNSWDRLATFSNYGATTVHIASPGVTILSSVPGGHFGYMSGTSMAAPFVSGVAALMFREAPTVSGYQIKSALMDSGDSVPYLAGKVSSGKRVAAYGAVQAAKTMTGAAFFQPAYAPQYQAGSRAPASASSSSGSHAGGCGSIVALKSLFRGGGDSGGFGGGFGSGLVFGFMTLPLVAWLTLRRKVATTEAKLAPQSSFKRRHERFRMKSQIEVSVGDRRLVGQVMTIGQGGVSFNLDEMLEKGGVVKMSIQSPDGKEAFEVEGQVVWSEQDQRFGVQFQGAADSVTQMISQWSQGLLKA